MSDWFIISDISDFTDRVRTIVYTNFGEWRGSSNTFAIREISLKEQEEFNKVLSHNESLIIVKSLVKKQKNKKRDKIRYVLDDKIFAKIVYDLNSRMVSNILNSLVQKNLVESAFDEESNDFIFWVKNTNEENLEKPETD
jgi:hypothetical protein